MNHIPTSKKFNLFEKLNSLSLACLFVLGFLTADSMAALNYTDQSSEKFLFNSNLKPYYGLSHAHTSLSDGKLEPEDAYESARKNGLDYFAVTDHLEKLWMKKSKWRTLLNQADQANAPGDFIAITGFEWGGVPTIKGWMNHVNVIGTYELFSPFSGLSGVYKKIQKLKGSPIGQFNHPGNEATPKVLIGNNQWRDFKYSSIGDKSMKLIRVGTGIQRGSRNHENIGYVPALDKGWHLAPQSSEDNHRANWGNGKRRTGVWASELSRDAIMNAFRTLCTFYTDDANASVLLTANGKWLMGSTVEEKGVITLEVDASDMDSKDEVATVELVTYLGLVAERSLSGSYPYRTVFKVDPKVDTYYFVRVLQKDGDRLISAPIFVNR